ncbi:MAG: polysulfide reductase NrfD [Thaumarchaeota archaeon]|nr:polysulfide reductase NrfD [Nitrososphaerota archaeon]
MAKRALQRDYSAFIAPIVASGRLYYGFMAVLLGVVGIGLYAYSTQLAEGLVVTGMRSRVSWGLYITNFVFFIGISHAGTLISAILRVTNTGWRRPITRIAEAITVLALIFGASSVILDLGRPDRMHHLFIYADIQSPLIWDFISITTYLTGSAIYLFLPLIPDIAELRDSLTETSRIKRRLYNTLSMGWRGTEWVQFTLVSQH